jgi:hypothetical protein
MLQNLLKKYIQILFLVARVDSSSYDNLYKHEDSAKD